VTLFTAASADGERELAWLDLSIALLGT